MRLRLSKLHFYFRLTSFAIVIADRHIILALSWWRRFEVLIWSNLIEGGYYPALFNICLRIGRLDEFDSSGILFILEIFKKTLITYKKLFKRRSNCEHI